MNECLFSLFGSMCGQCRFAPIQIHLDVRSGKSLRNVSADLQEIIGARTIKQSVCLSVEIIGEEGVRVLFDGCSSKCDLFA